MDISSGLSSIQSAIELAKFIGSAGSIVEKAELKLKTAELLIALADAKIALASAASEMADLREANKRRSLREQTSVWPADGVYLTLDGSGLAVDGPFCGRCFDVDYNLIRIATDMSGRRGMGYCPQCKNKYRLWSAEQRLADDQKNAGVPVPAALEILRRAGQGNAPLPGDELPAAAQHC